MDRPGGTWLPTPDFEIWPLGKGKQRSPVRQPFDDFNPDSVCAMGELLLEAALAYYPIVNPDLIAMAYGDSSPSFQIMGVPSENEVMNRCFRERFPKAPLAEWDPIKEDSDGKLSGTYNEAANLLRLYRDGGFDELFIVARGFHARAHAFTAIRLREPAFEDLNGRKFITPMTVEDVLLEHRPGKFDERIAIIRNSRSIVRSLMRECNALMNFNKGATQIIQKPVAVTA